VAGRRIVDATASIADLKGRVASWVGEALEASAELGFLGSMPVSDQIDHALGFVASVESVTERPPRSVLDLGSGGGVPGLVLCSCWPETRVVLLDSNERRTEFLAGELSRRQVDPPEGGRVVQDVVVRGRAEESARMEGLRQTFEVVTARSFGAPAVTAECGAPLLAVGGLLVVSEPPDAPGADRWPAAALEQLGLETLKAVRVDDRFGYQILIKAGPTPDRFPRRVGIPTKRPLF